MKKLFVIAMLATVGMAACSKDDTAPARRPEKVCPGNHPRGDGCPGRPALPSTAPRPTGWPVDKVAVLLYDGAATMTCEFTADKSGPTTTFTGDVPIGTYSLAAAYYPYRLQRHVRRREQDLQAHLGDRNTARTTWLPMTSCIRTSGRSPFEINEATTQLPVTLHVQTADGPHQDLARTGCERNAQESHPGDRQQRIADLRYDRRPGNFTASSVTNSIAVPTNRKEFVVGLLPVGIHSTMTVKVMTTDGLTYSDKSFTLAGLKRNHHYTMSVPCNKQNGDDHRTRCHRPEVRYAIPIRTTDSTRSIPNTTRKEFSMTGIFTRQRSRATRTATTNSKKNRIQLQIPAGFNNAQQRRFRDGPDPVRWFENREGILRGSDQPYRQY